MYDKALASTMGRYHPYSQAFEPALGWNIREMGGSVDGWIICNIGWFAGYRVWRAIDVLYSIVPEDEVTNLHAYLEKLTGTRRWSAAVDRLMPCVIHYDLDDIYPTDQPENRTKGHLPRR